VRQRWGDIAWKSRPSWYLVATNDRMIPPPAQRFMAERAGATVVEAADSHAIYLSQPDALAALIEQAYSAAMPRLEFGPAAEPLPAIAPHTFEHLLRLRL
jgi:hypothetical protein